MSEETGITWAGIRYIGIDPSFTGTAIVILDENGKIILNKTISTKDSKDVYDNERRIITIKREIFDILNDLGLSERRVAIEDIEFSFRRSRSISMLTGLNYAIRIMLLEYGMKYDMVNPKTLKRFVCNNGNAGKEDIMKAVYEKWGFMTNDNNQADALVIAEIIYEKYKKENI